MSNKTKNVKSNLCKEEEQALKDIREDHTIIIKEADNDIKRRYRLKIQIFYTKTKKTKRISINIFILLPVNLTMLKQLFHTTWQEGFVPSFLIPKREISVWRNLNCIYYVKNTPNNLWTMVWSAIEKHFSP